jgi:NAD(P)-dependent dehydrogenase (short-subunit alcohol dehydrogenase family)
MNKKAQKFLCSLGIDSFKGQTIFLSGGTSGIGYEAALMLSEMGASLIIGARNKEKAHKVEETIKSINSEAKIRFLFYEQSDVVSIQQLGESLKGTKLDVAILNAGVFHPQKGSQASNKCSLTFMTNAVGSYALAFSLASSHPETRIVLVSSLAKRRPKSYDYQTCLTSKPLPRFREYCVSKEAIANTFYLLKNNKHSAMLVEPGVVATNIYRNFPKWIMPLARSFMSLVALPSWKGALPLVVASSLTTPDFSYYRPSSFFGIYGYPKLTKEKRKDHLDCENLRLTMKNVFNIDGDF